MRGIQTRSMPDADPEHTGTDSSYTSLPIIVSMPCCANPGLSRSCPSSPSLWAEDMGAEISTPRRLRCCEHFAAQEG